MDSLTHTVLGACLGELIAGRKIGKKAMLIGALANNIPDIDVICYLWMDPSQALLAHRGITHSIIFNLLLAFLLAYVFKKVFTNLSLTYYRWLLMFGSGLFIHIFLDSFNAYGTGLFEPFDHARISFNALFIIDPFFTLPMLVSTIVLLLLRNNQAIRATWARGSIFLGTFYLILCAGNKIYADHITQKNISDQNIHSSDYFTTPTPLNNLLWYIVVHDKKQFHIGYYSIFDHGPIVFEKIDKNDSLLFPLKNSQDIENLIRFSKGYYCARKKDSAVVFNDLRFGQDQGWNYKNSGFIFNFNIQKDRKNVFMVQQGRFKSIKWKSISGLFSRIKGKNN